jgi:hypothetical protein
MKAIELLSIQTEIERAKANVITDRVDMTFGEIMSMYQDGEITISPEFQRLFRWDDYDKTRFIESILLGIPLPPIFVAQDEESKWELIDGLQRIATVLSFFGILKNGDGQLDRKKNNWAFCKGDLISAMEGKKKDDLPLILQRAIKRGRFGAEILRWNKDTKKLKYELFNRLHTGKEVITEQEIRNCIFRNQSNVFNDFLNQLAKNESLKRLTDISEQQEEQLYLQEFVLRFISLHLNQYQIDINEPISKYMTLYMEKAVEDDHFPYETTQKKFYQVISLLEQATDTVFKSSQGTFSVNLYDVVMLGVAQNIDFYEKNRPILKEKIKQLKQTDLLKSVSTDKENNKQNMLKRLELADRIFKINSL